MTPPPTSATLAPAEMDATLRRNMAAGFFGMIWVTAALGMPLPLLMRAVGASGFQLGLLSGAWQLAMVAQIFSALMVERLPRRKLFWAAVSLPHRLLWGVPALLPLLLPNRRDWWPAAIIAALALSNVLGQAGTAPWQSWMADLLPPERAGRFWGRRHRVLSCGLAVAALAYGFILDRESPAAHPFLGFQIVFAIAMVSGVVDILIHTAVHEPAPHPPAREATLGQRLRAPLQQKSFLRFTLAMGVWVGAQAMLGYNMGLPGFFSMVYLKEQFGASYGQTAVVFLATAVGAALFTPSVGRLIDHWGGRRVMLLLLTASPLAMLGWLALSPGAWSVAWLRAPLPQAIGVMSVVSLILGGLYSGSWVCQVRLTQMLTIPAGRTVSMGLHWSIVGLTGSLGPLLAGWVKDHFHAAHFTYYQLLVLLHIALTWGVALPMVRGIHEPARELA